MSRSDRNTSGQGLPEVPGLPELAAASFFVLRTPLLAFDELLRWQDALQVPEMLAGLDAAGLETVGADETRRAHLTEAADADSKLLRERLRNLFRRPELREAVFVASPSLEAELTSWVEGGEAATSDRAIAALVRYFLRMTSRATPFGLFSGCSVGPVETQPVEDQPVAGQPGDMQPADEGESAPAKPASGGLHLGPLADYQRHTRLDMDYLFALTEQLSKDPALRGELRFRPSSSLYRAAGRLRYAEARLQGKARAHHLVAVDEDEYLQAALAAASRPDGANVAELSQVLVALDPDGEITQEEALGYVYELIDSQLLVSDLSPPVTGPEPIHALVPQLAELETGKPVAQLLDRVRNDIDAIDNAGLGSEPQRYRAIAEILDPLPTDVELSRLFQVDMVKPAESLHLPAAVSQRTLEAMELLYRITPRPSRGGLADFREKFTERYGDGREMPLFDVLDEEAGIGFSGSRSADVAPLLQGLALGSPRQQQNQINWNRRDSWLLRRVQLASAAGERELELDDKDLEALSETDPAPLPDAFQAMIVLAGASSEAVAQGDFDLHLRGAYGPSGARLLGRFCHGDPELEAGVRDHVDLEEALRPDAVFAEIVHLPEGRIGNILCRPVLRTYEIPYLGRSGADAERQLPVSDLTVTVAGNRILLRSRSLGKEVIPRLTSAHNYSGRSVGVYRFLCELQAQNLAPGVMWTWGPLDNLPFLPRVRRGNLLLARASWQVTRSEIEALTKVKETERLLAVERWRRERWLPRWVSLADADNELLLDLTNPLLVDSFVELVSDRTQLRLVEPFPSPEDTALCVESPEGRFVHEINLPFTRRPPQPEAQEGAATGKVQDRQLARQVTRSFEPGSEWLYATLYGGAASADQVLADGIAPVVRQALRSGAADSWFFIRYADPDLHLRLRFHGDPGRLAAEVLPALRQGVAPMLGDGRLWRLRLDTYEREMERYGGPAGMEPSEKLFEYDSEAVLAIVRMLDGDEGAEYRWRLGVRGLDMLFEDFGLGLDQKLELATQMRSMYGREYDANDNKGVKAQLADLVRKHRRDLFSLLDPAQDQESELWPGFAALHARSKRSKSVIEQLFALEKEGALRGRVRDIVPSYGHMFVNRLMRSSQRAQEMVMYDLLQQTYVSLLARQRQGKKKQKKKEKKGTA